MGFQFQPCKVLIWLVLVVWVFFRFFFAFSLRIFWRSRNSHVKWLNQPSQIQFHWPISTVNLWKGSLIRPTGRLCKAVPKTNWPLASKNLPRNVPWVAEDLFLFCWWFQNESRIVSAEQYIYTYTVYLAVVESWLYRKRKDQIMLMLQVWMGMPGVLLDVFEALIFF